MEAHESKIREDEEADIAALEDGSWWDIVNMRSMNLSQEPQLRKVIVFSALSAGLSGKRQHLMAIGDSQTGKSNTFRTIGSRYFLTASLT